MTAEERMQADYPVPVEEYKSMDDLEKNSPYQDNQYGSQLVVMFEDEQWFSIDVWIHGEPQGSVKINMKTGEIHVGELSELQ